MLRLELDNNSALYLKVRSGIDHFNMGFLMVKNMKHLLVNVLMTLETLKKETSETALPVDDKSNTAVSTLFFPFDVAKIEVSIYYQQFISTSNSKSRHLREITIKIKRFRWRDKSLQSFKIKNF